MLMRIGIYLGTIIGFLGWLIGFALFMIAEHRTPLLMQVLPTGFVVSLGLAVVCIIVLEGVHLKHGAGHWLFQVTLWGMLLFAMGLMILLVNHWVAPLIENDVELAQKLTQAGSVYRVSNNVPLGLMGGGVVLLLIVLWTWGRNAATSQQTPG